MLVEEVPKSTANGSTVYFSSSINLSARPAFREEDGQPKKARAKVNYNLTDMMNAQIQAHANHDRNAPLKLSEQLQLERVVNKRLVELNRELPAFDLPKNFAYRMPGDTKTRLGNTPSTKRILAARRNLNSYFEEERNLISVNTILSVHYQFVDPQDTDGKAKAARVAKRRVRLCCVCGMTSPYSRCGDCGMYSCSVRCNRLHKELRCT